MNKGGRCFVVTAAYGHPLAREVIELSIFRDTVLKKSSFGRLLDCIRK